MTDQDKLEQTLRSLELDLLRPEFRHDPEKLRSLLAPDFIEIGSSGHHLTLEQIIAELASEPPFSAEISDFTVRTLAPDLAQVTYRLTIRRENEPTPRHSRRSSIWQDHSGAWRMLFHQGTPVSDAI